MKRRAFLTMLGLAPVVAQALPRPVDPSKLAKATPLSEAREIKVTVDIDENGEFDTFVKQSPISLAIWQGEKLEHILRK